MMDRLTKRIKVAGSNVTIVEECAVINSASLHVCSGLNLLKGCVLERVLDRLAAYEDTGLTPEEIIHRRLIQEDVDDGR